MRYSLCSYSLHRTVDAGQMDIFDYITFCREAGFTQLDPWMKHIEPAYLDDDYLEQVNVAAAVAGLPFGCVAVDGAHMYEPTAEGRALNQERRYRWLEVTAALGATQMRVDAGGRDETWEEIAPIVIAGYKDIVTRARPLGVEIVIENHWGPTNHPNVMRKLLDAVPGLGLLYDSYNWPAGTHARAWREYAKYARLTHFKTFRFDSFGNEPDWDIPGVVHMLQAAGYTGCWGIESTPTDGDERDAALKTLALLRRILETN